MSIVTPSLHSSAWLKLCIASVADQPGDVEHIVQDGGSEDGTLEWLKGDRRVKAFVEKDGGMYDALNRGFRRASGDVLGYLNCDEQYLPGALQSVAGFFEHNPDVDVIFGDVIMVSTSGDYLWNRKVQVPLQYHTWTCHLSTLSCATFFRREVFLKYPFIQTLKDAGDGEWMVRLLRDDIPMATLGAFTSAFTLTGANMSTGANARRENAQLRASAPGFVRHLRPVWIVQHRLRRLVGGMYRQRPFSYQLFTLSSPNRRVTFNVGQPKCTSTL